MPLRRPLTIILLSIMLLSGAAVAAPRILLEPRPGEFAVGYRVLYLDDAARSFGPRSALDGSLAPKPLSRPVQVHLWYPAVAGSGKELRYSDYLMAAEGPLQAGADAAGAREKKLASWKARPIRRGVAEARLDEILARAMLARLDAEPAKGPFPLVVYAPSINSDPNENSVIFEYLASCGYVVVAAPSVGLCEPEVSIDRAGARAQLGDIAFALSRAASEPYVDLEHIGVLGFSWGGLTSMLFATQHLGVDAVACLDGAATMPPYRSIADSFDWFVPRGLRAALLDVVLADDVRDLGFGAQALYADVYSWRIPKMTHGDFCSDGVIRFRLLASDSLAGPIVKSFEAVDRRLKIFFDAYLKGDAGARATLRAPEAPLAGSAWTSREALPAPPTPAQFVEIVETQGVDAAARLFHELRSRDPGLVPFDEQRLLRFATEWGPERSKDLLVLLDLNLEVYPNSVDTRFWLAQVYLALDDKTAAVKTLEKALSIDPSHEKAKKLLDQIR